MRKRLVLAVVVTSLLLTVVSPVDAQTDLDRAREEVAIATDRLEGFLTDLEQTQRRGDELAAQFWQVQSSAEKLELDIAVSETASEGLAVERAGLQREVRVIALDRYVTRSEKLGVGDHTSEADRAAAETLARLVVGGDNDAIGQLAIAAAEHDRTQSQLGEQRDEQQLALAEMAATQSSLVEELDRLASLRVNLDNELSALEYALDELEAVEAEQQAVAAEQVRIEEDRRRAEVAAVAAAALARQVPTPAPTALPTPLPTATEVPNPQLPDVTATAVPNPQLPDVTATAVPNPQLPDVTATAVPNPQPSTPVAPSSGSGIVCPLAGPFTHTDDFSAPRAVGGVHRANDLISPQGTPVLAVSSGTIEHRNSSVGGMSAHLKGDNGDYYFYTHLSGYENVDAGHVAAGTVIGYVGMTGNAPIPHLHFEIHSGGYGNYSNPYGPVRQACF